MNIQNPQQKPGMQMKDVKRLIDATLRNRVAYRIGRITAVEATGTYSVSILGQSESMLQVPNLSGRDWSVGQEVTVFFVENDPQRPQIIGKAGYTSRNL